MTKRPTNGRRRAPVTRQAIIAATRRVLLSGNFRPTAKEIAQADGFTVRTLHDHYSSLEDLYIAAIDQETAAALVALLPLINEIALARVVVTGRLAS